MFRIEKCGNGYNVDGVLHNFVARKADSEKYEYFLVDAKDSSKEFSLGHAAIFPVPHDESFLEV